MRVGQAGIEMWSAVYYFDMWQRGGYAVYTWQMLDILRVVKVMSPESRNESDEG